jgi:small subunit ribosomal protein S20
MPNTQSAKKRMKTDEKSRVSNKSVKSRITTTRKKLIEVIENGKLDESKKMFREYSSLLDKAVKKKIVKANAANRRKSRIALRIKKLS